MPAIGSERRSSARYEPSTWAPFFRGETPRSQFISLSPEILSSLVSGTLVPPGVSVPSLQEDTWYDGTPVEEDVAELSGQTDRTYAQLELQHLCQTINTSISELGGAVAPKLDAVAPTDAIWVSFHQSLRCESGAEVLTLIAASERVMNVVHNHGCQVLALRAWIPDIEDMMQFRVFVKDARIIAISQRNTAVRSSLVDTDMDRIVITVSRQFQSSARDSFARTFIAAHGVDNDRQANSGDERDRYVYDVFLDRGWRSWILDFAQWGHPTDPLLYSWDELERCTWMLASECRAQLRCVNNQSAIRPAQSLYDAVPVELRSTEASGALAEAAKRLTQNHLLFSSDSEDET